MNPSLLGSALALALLALAMLLTLVRLLKGPTAGPRAGTGLHVPQRHAAHAGVGIQHGSSNYFEAALLVALFGFVGIDGHGQVPAARGGDRMTEQPLALWAEITIAVLVLLGAAIALIGSLGLLRLKDYFTSGCTPLHDRHHGVLGIMHATILFFSLQGHGFAAYPC